MNVFQKCQGIPTGSISHNFSSDAAAFFSKFESVPFICGSFFPKFECELSLTLLIISRARICKRLLVPIFGLGLKYNRNARFLAKLFEKKVLAKNHAL